MALPISPIAFPAPVQPVEAPKAGGSSDEFRGLLEGAIRKVDDTRHQAAQAVEGFLSGDGQELHSAIMAVQRADLAFELGLQVRNKVIAAYQEVMKMQL